MIGRLCMTTFVGLMALGASCDERGSFDIKTMKVNMTTVAHCIDPRRIDLKRGLQESCEVVGAIFGFGKKSTSSSASAAGGGWFGGSAHAASPTTYYPAPQPTQSYSQASGARVIHLN
jgi:hypothetical protein